MDEAVVGFWRELFVVTFDGLENFGFLLTGNFIAEVPNDGLGRLASQVLDERVSAFLDHFEQRPELEPLRGEVQNGVAELEVGLVQVVDVSDEDVEETREVAPAFRI